MLSGFREQFALIGVQLSLRYDGSPLIVENGTPPVDHSEIYTPTSVPGGRTPHVWLDGGRAIGSSLYDHLSRGFKPLRLGPRAPHASELSDTATRQNIPLKVLDVSDKDARDLYDCDLALIRPDQYVAWRGNSILADPDALLSQVTGGDH